MEKLLTTFYTIEASENTTTMATAQDFPREEFVENEAPAEDSEDEMGEAICSDLEVPLITKEFFFPIVQSYLSQIRETEWMILSTGNINVKIINLLTDMCNELIMEIGVMVLKVVAPQVMEWKKAKISMYSSGNCINNSQSCSLRNYEWLMDEDIEASITDSFNLSLSENLAVKEELLDSKRLVELLAAEVRYKVNLTLAELDSFQAPQVSPAQTEAPTVPGQSEDCTDPGQAHRNDSTAKDMVYLLAQILKTATQVTLPDSAYELSEEAESPSDEECPDSNCSICCAQDEENMAQIDGEEEAFYEVSEIVDTHSPVESMEEMQNMVDPGYECINWYEYMGYPGDKECSASPVHKLVQQDKSFLIMFISKLVAHIIESTNTPLFNVDVEDIVARLRKRLHGKLSSTLPQTVGEIHIQVFRKLCREFGSAHLLQVAMASRDEAFEKAVLKTLEVQLQMNSEDTSNFVNNGPTAQTETQQQPAIVRMFSSMTNFLRRSCNMCIDN